MRGREEKDNGAILNLNRDEQEVQSITVLLDFHRLGVDDSGLARPEHHPFLIRTLGDLSRHSSHHRINRVWVKSKRLIFVKTDLAENNGSRKTTVEPDNNGTFHPLGRGWLSLLA